MKRINVSFYDEIFSKLEARSKKKGMVSVAQSIRELIDLGLKVEEAQEKNNDKNNGEDDISLLLNLIKKHFKCSLESLFINRKLVEQLQKDGDSSDEFLVQCKEQASRQVANMPLNNGEMLNS